MSIHQQPEWPRFLWQGDAIVGPLAAARHKQGRLLGSMEVMGFDLRSEASLSVMTSDVLKSSAVEGERLDPDEVRSSLARRLGLDAGGLPTAGRDVEGIVEMMLDATRNTRRQDRQFHHRRRGPLRLVAWRLRTAQEC
jgi:Fic family protein